MCELRLRFEELTPFLRDFIRFAFTRAGLKDYLKFVILIKGKGYAWKCPYCDITIEAGTLIELTAKVKKHLDPNLKVEGWMEEV